MFRSCRYAFIIIKKGLKTDLPEKRKAALLNLNLSYRRDFYAVRTNSADR